MTAIVRAIALAEEIREMIRTRWQEEGRAGLMTRVHDAMLSRRDAYDALVEVLGPLVGDPELDKNQGERARVLARFDRVLAILKQAQRADQQRM
jgi:hypothetical protein